MMKKKNFNKKGFTLVELVVVIAIIGILAAIIVPTLTGYIKKAQRKADLDTARAIASCVTLAMTEDPTFESVFYGGTQGGGGCDYNVCISGEHYTIRSVARCDGTKTCKDHQKGWQRANGAAWDWTDNKYEYLRETLDQYIYTISGGSKDQFIPMQSSGYKHPSGECNHDNSPRDKSNTYSYTDRWVIVYRISKKGTRDYLNERGRFEVWAGDSQGRGANGPRCRLWPDPPSYY